VARQDGARFSLAHVVADLFAEPSYELMTTLPVDLDLQAHVMESARTSLEQLAEAIGAGRDSVLVEVGVPRNTLVALAEERGVDLIVLGNHGVHGLERLLGSTATAVLRAAPCDVYAVKIGST
jgi:universal stress protein A